MPPSSALPAKARVAVAVSGGVDSLCALLLLKRAGYDLFALHGLFFPNASPPALLAGICADLDVELVTVDLAGIFHRRVIEFFAQQYADALTPNPCAACNKFIKFGALLDSALMLGATSLATGHYARLIAAGDGRILPAMAADSTKDQSYFLSLVKAQSLQRAIFPLGEMRKDACRQIVRGAGLEVPVAVESQDICFVRGRDWHSLIKDLWQSRGLAEPAQGPVLLLGEHGKKERIGRHGGLWRYTLGQRKGLGIPWREPLYVLGKDRQHNALVVGAKAWGGSLFCGLGDLNILVKPGNWPEELFAKLRYRQKAMPCKARLEGGHIIMEFSRPAFAVPGQVGALYDARGTLLAGGIIQEGMK